MRFRRVVLIAACAVLLTGAAGPVDALPAVTVSRAPYRAEMTLERYQPRVSRPGAPVVVLVHGCCGDRRDMAGLARALARRGATVLNPDVHRLGTGGGWPESYFDVVCAVGAAHAIAAGSRPVALVGWSDGALLGAVTTLGWPALSRRADGCAAPAGGSGPDVFVGLGGHYGWPGDEPPADLVGPRTIQWFGGAPSAEPSAWHQGNPYWWLSHRSLGRANPPMHLVAGAVDEAAAAFAGALRARGITASLRAVPRATSLTLAQPRDVAGAVALRRLCRILHLPAEA